MSTQSAQMTGWRSSATDAPYLVAHLQRFRAQILRDYPLRDIIVLGMGGSALGARVMIDQHAAQLQQLGVRIRIVDTTEPSTIIAILNDFDAQRGLVIAASKSGSTIEPLCLMQVFFQHLSQVLGSPTAAAQHFVSISDEDTALTRLARAQNWRGALVSPADVGGRFSVMTAFGLAPLVLAGVDISEVLPSAADMQKRCLSDERCPAWQLATSLYQNYAEGRDKLLISYSDQATESFARWLEQLIAESLGKEGKGLIPLPMTGVRADKLQYRGLSDLQSITCAPRTAAALGAELIRWMFAVEHLAHYLQVDPFDQPNVEAVKTATRRALDITTAGYPGGLKEFSRDSRIACAHQLPDLVQQESYLVLMSWAPETPENLAALEQLAADLEECYQRPAVIAAGPHYLHASGQLYKGGPDSGIYLLLSQETEGDLPIPGAPYSLRQLYHAAFAGDLDVMLTRGRPLVRMN
ncbi:MAG: hypothetical protein FWF11_03030 [Coriobacteriia bacterium]|nr:hypothetical protein [Coriobacteriia bacterium]